MRAFQRTSNQDRTTDQSFFIEKSFNPPFPRSLDAGSLISTFLIMVYLHVLETLYTIILPKRCVAHLKFQLYSSVFTSFLLSQIRNQIYPTLT